MARYDASQVELLVLTFKEGLLSAVAHDLKLRVTQLTCEVQDGAVQVEIDASSLRVVSAMKDGAENPGGLPKVAFGEVERNAAKDVLDSRRHPKIHFVSTSISDTEVSGRLTLHGQVREVHGKRVGNTAEFSIDQREFGIKPFSAMLGTLKVKPTVVIRATLSGSTTPSPA